MSVSNRGIVRKRPGDRCDKCGLHISEWDSQPKCSGASITQSPRHTITRFHIPIPEEQRA